MFNKKLLRLGIFSLSLSLVLSSCSGDQRAESIFRPDPSLEATPTPTPASLPSTFPTSIPIYPQANLTTVEPGLSESEGKLTWQATDPSNLVEQYYLQNLQANNWSVETSGEGALQAKNENLALTINIKPVGSLTEIELAYQSLTPTTVIPSNPTTLRDVEQLREPERQYVQELATLGVFQPQDLGENGDFRPYETINRRDFARWLLTTYNLFYAQSPSKQIRLANSSSQPIFADVPSSDRDFAIIQGLAEAGLIPSPLTGDTTEANFRPDAPLTREDLITWKVPLDLRKTLPAATIDSIKETWGFRDSAEIDPLALRALYSDFQNGENANVRRVFGYTLLFQPQKPVTRAEAAAALWYFGYQGEGISARQALPTPSS